MTRTKKHFLLYFAIFPAVALLNMLFPAQLNQKLPYLHDIPTIMLAVMMLVWGRTLNSRIIHAQTRRCLVAVSYFLFALFVIRIARWEYFHTEFSDRLLWYLYYIPFIAVPLLSYHAALYLSPVKSRVQTVSLRAAWVLSILIAAGLLTNNLHGWVLQFEDNHTQQRLAVLCAVRNVRLAFRHGDCRSAPQLPSVAGTQALVCAGLHVCCPVAAACAV